MIASDASETAEETTDDASDATDDSADEASDAADETGASELTADELTGAADELTTALEDGVGSTTGVAVLPLKSQIRAMITITATMMIIQVLRFIEVLSVGGD